MNKKLVGVILFVVCLLFIGYLVKVSDRKTPDKPETKVSDQKMQAEVSDEKVPAEVPDAEKTEISGIVKSLPETAELVVKLGSAKNLYHHLSVTGNSIFGHPVKTIEEIKTTLGFNPLLISDLEANGLDTEKEIGFLLDDIRLPEKKPDDLSSPGKEGTHIFNFLLFIPVTDGRKVTEKISAVLTDYSAEKGDSGFKTSQEAPFTVFTSETDPHKVYLFEKDNYLFIGTNSQGSDPKAFMESFATGKSDLSETGNFRNVADSIASGEDFFAYFNVKKFFEKNLEAFKNYSDTSAGTGKPDMSKFLKYLKGWDAGGISADLDNTDLVMNSVVHADPGSEALKIMEDVQFRKQIVLGIPEKPVLLTSMGINWTEYYKMLSDSMTDNDRKKLRARLEKIRTEKGIDIEKDLIENSAGNLNLGIYDGASISAMNYNALLTLSIRDEAKAESLIEKIVAQLPPAQKAGVTKMDVGKTKAHVIPIFGFFQLYVGIKDHNLIVSVGKSMFEKAVSADISTGFTSAIQDKALAEILKEDAGSFYLNIDETFKAVKNFSAIMPASIRPVYEKLSEVSDQFGYILSNSNVKDSSVFGQLLIKTNFSEPFFREMLKYSDLFAEDTEG